MSITKIPQIIISNLPTSITTLILSKFFYKYGIYIDDIYNIIENNIYIISFNKYNEYLHCMNKLNGLYIEGFKIIMEEYKNNNNNTHLNEQVTEKEQNVKNYDDDNDVNMEVLESNINSISETNNIIVETEKLINKNTNNTIKEKQTINNNDNLSSSKWEAMKNNTPATEAFNAIERPLISSFNSELKSIESILSQIPLDKISSAENSLAIQNINSTLNNVLNLVKSKIAEPISSQAGRKFEETKCRPSSKTPPRSNRRSKTPPYRGRNKSPYYRRSVSPRYQRRKKSRSPYSHYNRRHSSRSQSPRYRRRNNSRSLSPQYRRRNDSRSPPPRYTRRYNSRSLSPRYVRRSRSYSRQSPSRYAGKAQSTIQTVSVRIRSKSPLPKNNTSIENMQRESFSKTATGPPPLETVNPLKFNSVLKTTANEKITGATIRTFTLNSIPVSKSRFSDYN